MTARALFAVLLAALLAGIPARAADVSERAVNLETPTGTLSGTLKSPVAGPTTTAVLILAGSGPTDRDGNSEQFGLHPDTLKLIAQSLAAHDITSLRADKRGIGQSAGAMRTESDVRVKTYADDANAWVTELKRATGAQCVWLLGHSEGALAAEIAAQDNPDICGLILIAGAGRRLGDVIRAQLTASPNLPDPLRQTALAILAELEAGRTVASPPPELMSLFRPSVQPYMISLLAIDPAALLSQIKVPVLILQGTNDLQISVDDARLLKKAEPNAKLVLFDGVNHVLKSAPTDRAGNIATYKDASLPLAPGVSDAIVAFIAHPATP